MSTLNISLQGLFADYLQKIYALLRLRISGRDGVDPLQLQKQVEEMIQHYIQDTNHERIHQSFFLAEASFYRGNYFQALGLYEEVDTLLPIKFYLLRVRAFICYQHKEWEESIQLLQSAEKIFALDPISIELLSALYRESAKEEELMKTAFRLRNLPEILAEEEIEKSFGARLSGETASMELEEISLTKSPKEEVTYIEELDQLSRFLDHSETFSMNFPLVPNSSTGSEEDEDSMRRLLEQLLSPAPIEKSLFSQSAPSNAASTSNYDLVAAYGTEFIERRIQTFHEQQGILLKNYMDRSTQQRPLEEQCFYLLSSGSLEEGEPSSKENKNYIPTPLLPEYYRRSSSGFYFRWNGKGIVVNPGINFIKAFHQKELYITHIDHVIVTTDHPDTYADLKGIYDLNYQYNQVRGMRDPHVVHYYLQSGVFQEMAPELKPNFKQERHMLHALELYLDSPGEEFIALSDDINLYYFPILPLSSHGVGKVAPSHETKLAIRLELASHSKVNPTVKIAMVLGGVWSPELIPSLQGIDLLIAAFEKTHDIDYKKIAYREDCLGYYGTYTLLKECNPKLFIACNFDGSNGDIRLDMVKKIRRELISENGEIHNSVILPGDRELAINLEEFYINCSVCNHYILPEQVKVIKSKESFGTLRYLCGDCLL